MVCGREAVRRSLALGAKPNPVPRSGRPPLAVLDSAEVRQSGYRFRALPDLGGRWSLVGTNRGARRASGRLWNLHPSALGGARQRRLATADLLLLRLARPKMGR